jgi:hypothetical protein
MFSVTTRCVLVTAADKGFRAEALLNAGSFPTLYSYSSCPPYNPSAMTTIETPVSNSTSTVARGLLQRVPVCLRSLPRNGSTRYNI